MEQPDLIDPSRGRNCSSSVHSWSLSCAGSAWAPPAANQAENTIFYLAQLTAPSLTGNFISSPKTLMSAILGISEWKQSLTGAPGTGDCRASQIPPGTRDPGGDKSFLWVLLHWESSWYNRYSLVVVPTQCKPIWFWLQDDLFVPEVSPPSLCPQEWELSTPGLGHPCAPRHPTVLNRQNAPSWHNLYRKEEGESTVRVEQSRDFWLNFWISDPQNPPQTAPKGWGLMGQPLTAAAAKPTCSASFPPFLIKTLPWYREALTKHNKACSCQGMIAASIYFSTIIFRVVLSRQTRSRSGVCSTSSWINPGRLYDSGMTHCSSSVPSRLLGVC